LKKLCLQNAIRVGVPSERFKLQLLEQKFFSMDSLYLKIDDENKALFNKRKQCIQTLRLMDVKTSHQHSYILCRRQIIEWMRDVCKEQNQLLHTFLLSCSIMDYFIALLFPKQLRVHNYQLAACGALLLSSKSI